jgi:hypothetical protein
MSIDKELLQRIFYSSVEEKQRCAEDIYRKYKFLLLSNKDLQKDFDILQKHTQLLNAHMGKMGMGELCSRCAENEGGGCCSHYMAGETDAIQLLMNLLVGVDVKQLRSDDVECCFLGENGCLFSIKPMFCLNYNCTRIHQAAASENIDTLGNLTGKLLGQQYEIEGKLLELLQKYEEKNENLI